MFSYSRSQTQKFAAILAKKISQASSVQRHASIITLHGDLGAGKTTFVQGFARGLGIKNKITSPTFLIIRKYLIRRPASGVQRPAFKNLYHLDLYRIHKPKELLALGFKEIISNPENIVLIEWPERIKKLLPKNTMWIVLEHGKKENERLIFIEK